MKEPAKQSRPRRSLNALGRKPKVAGLGLENVGVELADGVIAVNAHQQTSIPTIFAAGDCCGPFEIVHMAIEQGERAARNAVRLLQNDSEAGERGLSAEALCQSSPSRKWRLSAFQSSEAKAKNIDHLVASYPFCDHGKSIIMDEMDGFVKLLADKSTREITWGFSCGTGRIGVDSRGGRCHAFSCTAAGRARHDSALPPNPRVRSGSIRLRSWREYHLNRRSSSPGPTRPPTRKR